jgi:hypothetical protein
VHDYLGASRGLTDEELGVFNLAMGVPVSADLVGVVKEKYAETLGALKAVADARHLNGHVDGLHKPGGTSEELSEQEGRPKARHRRAQSLVGVDEARVLDKPRAGTSVSPAPEGGQRRFGLRLPIAEGDECSIVFGYAWQKPEDGMLVGILRTTSVSGANSAFFEFDVTSCPAAKVYGTTSILKWPKNQVRPVCCLDAGYYVSLHRQDLVDEMYAKKVLANLRGADDTTPIICLLEPGKAAAIPCCHLLTHLYAMGEVGLVSEAGVDALSAWKDYHADAVKSSR